MISTPLKDSSEFSDMRESKASFSHYFMQFSLFP